MNPNKEAVLWKHYWSSIKLWWGTAQEYEQLAEKAAEAFSEVVVKHTEKEGDATRFASEAATDFDSVFAMGGDGTVNEAVNGLAPHDKRPNFGSSRWEQ